jgi:hypothetical protein
MSHPENYSKLFAHKSKPTFRKHVFNFDEDSKRFNNVSIYAPISNHPQVHRPPETAVRDSIQMERRPPSIISEDPLLPGYKAKARRSSVTNDKDAGIRTINNNQGEVVTDAQGRLVSMHIDQRGGVKRGYANINEYSSNMHMRDFANHKFVFNNIEFEKR